MTHVRQSAPHKAQRLHLINGSGRSTMKLEKSSDHNSGYPHQVLGSPVRQIQVEAGTLQPRTYRNTQSYANRLFSP